MEFLKKYWWLIPLFAVVGYIVFVFMKASSTATMMEKVREAKLEKSLNKQAEQDAGQGEKVN